MTTIIKTFFIEKEEICPNEITKKLKEHYSAMDKCLKGDLYQYETDTEGVIRYDTNQFEILTYDNTKNYKIKSELEKILGIKLAELN